MTTLELFGSVEAWLKSPTVEPRYLEVFLRDNDEKPQLLWERFIGLRGMFLAM
jgi:hypothetical protein